MAGGLIHKPAAAEPDHGWLNVMNLPHAQVFPRTSTDSLRKRLKRQQLLLLSPCRSTSGRDEFSS
jgi:hypothetical protein